MAALNEPYTGDLQGIRGADFACYRQARRAGLMGTFKAFLSARYVCIYRFRRDPVNNPKRNTVMFEWNSMKIFPKWATFLLIYFL